MASSIQRSASSTDSSNHPIRVIKFGGSLLEAPESLGWFNSWHARQTEAIDFMIVGGGVAVDQLRHWDSHCALPASWLHLEAIAQMSANTRLLAQRLPEWFYWQAPSSLLDFIDPPQRGPNIRSRFVLHRRVLLDAHRWLTTDSSLPHDWSVTSDSIAAHLASLISADELVLLKSVGPPAATGPCPLERAEFVQGTWVDRAFASYSRPIKTLRMVNLKDPSLPEIRFGPVTQAGEAR